MLTIRKAEDRGTSRISWLDSHHTFSFSDYYDARHMGFRALRVINDDTVAPAGGFGTHPHRDMEIVTYVLDGALEHADSLGTGSVIRPGDVQKMSAGTGIRHSESNASKTEPLHLMQFWIHPAERGLKPSWEQKEFTHQQRQSRLLPVASGRPLDGALRIHHDATVYISALSAGDQAALELVAGRRAYLFVIDGALVVNGKALSAGDQLRAENEARLELQASKAAELLLIDLP